MDIREHWCSLMFEKSNTVFKRLYVSPKGNVLCMNIKNNMMTYRKYEHVTLLLKLNRIFQWLRIEAIEMMVDVAGYAKHQDTLEKMHNKSRHVWLFFYISWHCKVLCHSVQLNHTVFLWILTAWGILYDHVNAWYAVGNFNSVHTTQVSLWDHVWLPTVWK